MVKRIYVKKSTGFQMVYDKYESYTAILSRFLMLVTVLHVFNLCYITSMTVLVLR